MKTIVLGYADANARGASKILAGTEVPQSDQVKLMTGIKATREFPKGIVRVEFCEVISRNTAISLDPALADKAEAKTKTKTKP